MLVHYTTPGITQETITIGSYSASNAQIGGHYLSADGTLNFTEGRTEDFIDITILGNPLNAGETRLVYVDLDPVHPAEGSVFLRGQYRLYMQRLFTWVVVVIVYFLYYNSNNLTYRTRE